MGGARVRSRMKFAGTIMAIDSLVQPLTRIELFHGLSAEQLQLISSRADRIVYKPGDVIVTANTEVEGAVLIVSGEASRVAGPGVGEVAEPIPAGSLLLEMAMMIEDGGAIDDRGALAHSCVAHSPRRYARTHGQRSLDRRSLHRTHLQQAQ